MEQWNLSQYEKPILHAPILKLNKIGTIEIGESSCELELTSNDPQLMYDRLLLLCEGDSKAWTSFSNSNEKTEEFQVLRALHEYGLIREMNPFHTIEKKECIYQDVLAEAIEAITPWRNSLEFEIYELDQFVENIDSADFKELLARESNVFSLYAKIALISWNQICPPAVTATRHLISLLHDEDVKELNNDFSAYWVGEVRKCLSVILWALVRSKGKDAERKTFPELLIERPDSGTNLALRLERWAIESLQEFGEASFPKALNSNMHGCQETLIQAVYAQEYYITDRFVDLVSNAMTLRLSPPLKKLLRRYYSEEMGHESYELRTCIQLGLEEDSIHRSLPVPIAQLLCDMYTYLGGNHVVAYCAAATITEGLPGQPNIINEAVANSGIFDEQANESSRKHESLNEKLAHPYISRLLLAECGEQSVDTQKTARDCYGLLLEMTWRAWEELHYLHVLQKKPALSFSMKDFLPS